MTVDKYRAELEFMVEFGKRSGKYAALVKIRDDIRRIFTEGLDKDLEYFEIFENVFEHLSKKQQEYLDEYVNFKKD